LVEAAQEHSELECFRAFLCRLTTAVAGQRPSLLFGEAQSNAYAAVHRLDRQAAPLLSSLLDAGVSLADSDRVRGALDAAAVHASDEAAEVVRARLTTQRVLVEASSHYVDELCRHAPGEDRAELGRAIVRPAEYFADELGVQLPAGELRRGENLARSEFRVSVGGRESLPLLGLGSGELMVNAQPGQLAGMGIDERPAYNPVWNQPAAIVGVEDGEKVREQGFISWDQLEFVQLCVVGEVRSSAHLLVTADDVYHRLVRLDGRLPRLARLTGTGYAAASRLAPIMRALVRENVSIRDFDGILTELTLNGRGSDQPVEAVRRAFAPSISRRNMIGNTLVAYLLDPAIVAAAAPVDGRGRDPRGEDDAHSESIRSAVWRELSYLPPTVSRPVVLTDVETRPRIRRILEPELPDISVLSYREVPPDINVQPVARILLEAA
jgi:flagellar biosynthesis component FlhA